MAVSAARKQEEATGLDKVRRLHDALRELVAERNRLLTEVRNQQAEIRQLQQRCVELDGKRSNAKEKIEHLMQQLPP